MTRRKKVVKERDSIYHYDRVVIGKLKADMANVHQIVGICRCLAELVIDWIAPFPLLEFGIQLPDSGMDLRLGFCQGLGGIQFAVYSAFYHSETAELAEESHIAVIICG